MREGGERKGEGEKREEGIEVEYGMGGDREGRKRDIKEGRWK